LPSLVSAAPSRRCAFPPRDARDWRDMRAARHAVVRARCARQPHRPLARPYWALR